MNHKQEVLLDKFFSNVELWWPNSYGNKVVSFIMLPLAIFLLILPCQMWEGDYHLIIMVFLLEFMGLEMYLKPYFVFLDDSGKIVRVDDIIRYLPVSYKQLTLYRWKKLIKLCLRLTGITMFCQVAFSFAFLHTVTWGNILMPLICTLILPVSMIILVNRKHCFT